MHIDQEFRFKNGVGFIITKISGDMVRIKWLARGFEEAVYKSAIIRSVENELIQIVAKGEIKC